MSLTALAMLAFASNSLLCRAALKHTAIDPATFTTLRIVAGAGVLCWLTGRRAQRPAGSWRSALALFIYAAAFSFAYVELEAGTGALLLFGAVQLTMIGHGCWRGERLGLAQWSGLVLALGGLAALLLPSASAPPGHSTLLMLVAGMAWGIYSLRGSAQSSALAATAGNFLRAVPFALALSLVGWPAPWPGLTGVALAAASGALASGVGYATWCAALRGLRSSQAAAVQLTVPVVATVGGTALLGESITLHQALASAAVPGGVGLVLFVRNIKAAATF